MKMIRILYELPQVEELFKAERQTVAKNIWKEFWGIKNCFKTHAGFCQSWPWQLCWPWGHHEFSSSYLFLVMWHLKNAAVSLLAQGILSQTTNACCWAMLAFVPCAVIFVLWGRTWSRPKVLRRDGPPSHTNTCVYNIFRYAFSGACTSTRKKKHPSK